MTRLDKALNALGSALSDELREHWLDMNKTAVPSVPPALLRRLLAQNLQEKRHGSLPLLVIRELERVASSSGPVSAAPRVATPLTPGTRLIREWNGRTITVEVQADGFHWDGTRYRSLSEIAQSVTGAHWSGPRFFGLKHRGR